MSSNDAISNTELIRRFLQKQLSPEEEIIWKKRSQDEAFNREVEFHSNLKSVIVSEKEKEFKQILVEEERRIRQEKTGIVRLIPRMNSKVMLLAAVFLILLIVTYISLTGVIKSDSPQQIFAENFMIYPNQIEISSRGETQRNERQEVMMLYDNAEFRKALDAMNVIDPLNTDSDLSFYKSIFMMQVGEFSTAQAIFKELSRSGTSNFSGPVNWYLALSFLKTDEVEIAIERLTSISLDPDHYQSNKVKMLLEKLN